MRTQQGRNEVGDKVRNSELQQSQTWETKIPNENEDAVHKKIGERFQ